MSSKFAGKFGGSFMAARLTDRKKKEKKIIADYLELQSYNATAKKNKVCPDTVKRPEGKRLKESKDE